MQLIQGRGHLVVGVATRAEEICNRMQGDVCLPKKGTAFRTGNVSQRGRVITILNHRKSVGSGQVFDYQMRLFHNGIVAYGVTE